MEGQANGAALRDTLVGIVLDFYAGWEPQSGSLDRAIERGRRYFVTDSTFAMIIDTTYRSTYDQWAARTAVSIPDAYKEYQEQHHHVTAAKVLLLGNEAAVLSMRYCVDFVKRDGTRGIADGSGATLVFVRRPQGWRIAHYHGSHHPETLTDSKCPI
jgi:hypothetical protein